MSRHMGVNNLPRVVSQPRPGRESNSRPLDRKSDALPLRHHATPQVVVDNCGDGLRLGR